MFIAYQTDRNELVGIAMVTQSCDEDTYVHLKPLERIAVKVRPLKLADQKIATIPALQPGPIQTLYDISHEDAEHLVAAARTRRRNA
jgi:hypothetical protein